MIGRYQQLLAGLTVLESNLHKHLIEHVVSEVNLGTITNTATATTWVRNSFFFQRIQKNPGHYASVVAADTVQSWQERIGELVSGAIAALKSAEIITVSGDDDTVKDAINITELGEIMSRVCIWQLPLQRDGLMSLPVLPQI
jgi:ATP-dependent DNA helicase HFM1/MER3